LPIERERFDLERERDLDGLMRVLVSSLVVVSLDRATRLTARFKNEPLSTFFGLSSASGAFTALSQRSLE